MSEELFKTSRIHRPTVAKLAEIAAARGFDSTTEELAIYKKHIDHLLKSYDKLDEYPDPALPVKYARTPGYRPAPEENKYNAWYYKTNIVGAASGRLLGKKVAIKDSIPVAGVPMMNGSPLLEGYTPEFDATVVTKILEAGGVVAGKAVCEHFCLSGSSYTTSSGTVLNPHDVTRSAGGSSCGSAVLVAAGEVDMALGCDQGGSIRLPACWCGVVGLKPTWGLVPYTGCAIIEPTVDHVGPMAKTVSDCALLLEAIAGYDNGLDTRQHRDLKVENYTAKLTGDLTGVKVGLVKEGFAECESDVETTVKGAAKMMETVGASVEDFSLPIHADGPAIWSPACMEGCYMNMIDGAGAPTGRKDYYAVSMADAARKGYMTRPNDLSDTMKFVSLFGDYMQANYGRHYYGRSMNVSRTMTAKYDEALEKYDVLIMPTIKFKAPKLPKADADIDTIITESLSMVANTVPFNITGHPACSINAGFSEGLPVGMMIIGKHFDDATVLKVAHAFEQQRDKDVTA